MRAHASRPLGLMLALAMLLPLVLVTGTMGASLPARAAESSAPPYATAKLEKVADGTGHGTAAQSFVNSKNGFAPGDDSPTDGVVASGDTVEYRIRLEFTAARKRTVDVRFDMSQAPMLDSIVGGSFCTNGRLVTAKRSGDTCSYTVPAGAVESMTQSVVMRARDTGGKAVENQLVTAGVSRDGGEETVYRADPVTVVSAPAADLEVDNGGMPDNQRSVERRLSWSDGGTADGWFDLKVVQLHYQGYSSHGASTQGAWSGTIDVSEFPASTTWTMDGKPLTVSNGKIKVSGLTGGKRLSYSFKYADMKKPMEKDTTQYLAIGVETDEGSFSTGEGDDVLMNLGDGSEPGRGMGRDESTYDAKTGAIRGYPYANNNWSRAIIDRYDPPAGAIFWKTLEKPDANGYTIFDEENRSFENANDSGQTVYHSGYADKVSQGTQVRTILHAYANRITGCADQCNVIMGDNWDRNSSWLGDLKVTMGGVDISPEDYTLEWTTKRADASDETAGWRTGEPDPKTARGMRVKLSDSLPFGGEAGAGTLEISFLVTASGDPGQSNVTASDAMTGTFANAVNVEGSKIDSDYYVIVAPGTPAAAADYSVAVTDPDGNRRDDARPGDTVSWSTGDGLRVLNVQSSKTALAPRVTVCVAAGTLDPVNDNLQWKMTRKPGSDGCAYNLEFTLANPVTPSYSQSGQASLPMVKWHGTVANKASGSPQSSLVLHVDGAQVGTIPGFSVEATASASYVVSKASGSAGVVGADQTKVEIDDPIRFHWNIYKKDSNLKGSMRTVLKLPSNKDAAMTGADNKGPDGSWNEYDMGSSKFEGTLALAGEPTLDADNSTGTTLKYSTQDLNSEDPDAYEWRTWDQLSDSERAQVKAILVTSEPEALDGTNLAASRGTLTLQPNGNTEKDKYNLWIGANRVDASTENVPWPAQSVVVMGSISGTVWWDRNENTLQGKDEDTIPGIEVSLWKVDQDGNKTGDKPFATTSTDDKGYYLFDHLHSGSYMTEVKRSEGTVTDDGVQTTVTTYYGQSKPVSNTRSWSNRLKEDAKDNSDRINLTIDQDLKHVDYGYAKPDPKATLDKKTTSVKCKDGDNKDDQYCDITWDVAVENKGKTTSEPSLDITAATGSNLLDSAEGSLVASSDGAWLVRPDGSTIKVQGVTGSITAAIGDWPLESNDGSLVASSDGAWLVRPDGSTIKVQGVTGSITAATGDWPLNSNGGSLVASSDGAWLVKPDGSTIKVQGATGSITTATGVHPLGSTFGSLVASSDGAWLVKPDGSTIKVQGLSGGVDDSESTSGTSVFPTSSTLSDRMSDMVSDVSATAGTESVEPGGADRASSTANHTLYWDSQSGAGYASGYNMYGQLGTGDTSNSSTPLPIDGAWRQLAAGGMHSAGVGLDGALYVWGSDSNGQLGTGDATDRNTPTQVQQGTQFTAVAAGADFTVAAKTDGGVMMAGRGKDSWSEVNAGVRFAQLSAFGDTWLGITEAGELYQGSGSGAASANASGTTFLMADAGDDHNLALDSENHVWAWGSSNSHRQQGGSSSNSSPTKVSALADKQFTQVSAGYLSSMLVESGTNHVWSWGWDGYGQLADGNAHDGRAWDNGSAITGNIVSTPADTGLTASWVEMSYQHSVIIGDKVREAGYDAYGSTAMTGSGNPVDTGLKGAGKSTDPTAVPVEPISETTADGYATRVYNLPFTVQPGGRVVFHFKGRVQRDKAEKLAVNQAWFDSPDTPYSGTPNAGGKTTPDLPDASKHDETTDDIVGNTTCRADADYKLDGQQHWFSSGNEDSCDQVGVPIPAVTQVKPGAPKGSISGLYWRDTDEDGVRDTDETERIPGQQVVLFDKDGAQVAVTETNERGEYSFTGLRYGEYTVQFSQVKRSPFTKADVNDTDIPNDAGRADSDAKTGEDDYGEASPTIVLNTAKPDWTDVDAGVTPSEGWLSGMPFTGQGQWVVLVAVAAVMLLAGSAILLRGSRK